MTFNDSLVVGKSIKNPDKIKNKFNEKKPVFKGSLVCNNNGRLEIYSTLQFVQKNLLDLDLDVVAMFKEEGESFEFIRTLCDISVREFGEVDLLKALPFYKAEVT